jgi:hypothetical protein
MNKEVKDFAEKAKKRMLGWSETIDDPHARVYARAFCNIVDECVDVLEYGEREKRLDEVARKLVNRGYIVTRIDADRLRVIREATGPLEGPRVFDLTYEEAIKLVEEKNEKLP